MYITLIPRITFDEGFGQFFPSTLLGSFALGLQDGLALLRGGSSGEKTLESVLNRTGDVLVGFDFFIAPGGVVQSPLPAVDWSRRRSVF